MNFAARTVGLGLTLAYRTREWLRHRRQPPRTGAPAAPPAPTFLGIEPTNICNANCVFCGYQYQERPKTTMSFEAFKTVIDQYAALGGGRLSLTPMVGDALIDPQLVDKITYASQFPQLRPIFLYTNAILLTREKFEQLVDAGVESLAISMTSFDGEEYRRIYRSPAYPKILQHLYAIAESDRFPRCEITINLRTTKFLPTRQPDYRRLARLGYKFERTTFFDNWSNRIRPEDLPAFMYVRPQRAKTRPCHILYGGPTLLANGTLTACGCRDLIGDSELVLGHISEVSLGQAWQEGKMEALRQRFLDGDPPDVCRDCRHYVPID